MTIIRRLLAYFRRRDLTRLTPYQKMIWLSMRRVK